MYRAARGAHVDLGALNFGQASKEKPGLGVEHVGMGSDIARSVERTIRVWIIEQERDRLRGQLGATAERRGARPVRPAVAIGKSIRNRI